MKIENAFRFSKNKFDILTNKNVGLKYAPIVIITCCILQKNLIDNESIGEQNLMDLHPNSCDNEQLNPIAYENEKQSKSIAKKYRNILYWKWIKHRYEMEHIQYENEIELEIFLKINK